MIAGSARRCQLAAAELKARSLQQALSELGSSGCSRALAFSPMCPHSAHPRSRFSRIKEQSDEAGRQRRPHVEERIRTQKGRRCTLESRSRRRMGRIQDVNLVSQKKFEGDLEP